MAGNNRRLIVSPEAADDLISIWRFGAQEWSSEQADRHLRDIDEAFERLIEEPKLGRKRDDLIPNLRSIVLRPHLIFYRESSKAIEIVRVLHERFDTIVYFHQ